MSRSRAAVRTWIGSLAYSAVTMLTGFVVTPIILRILGTSRFGIVRTITEGTGYLTLVAQGITVAMVPMLASSVAKGDRSQLYRTLKTGLRVYFLTSLVFLLVGLALTPVIGRIFHVDPGSRSELRMAWLVCLIGVPLVALSPMKVLIDLAHKGYISHLMLALQGVLTAVLSITLVWWGMGVVGVMVATLAASLVYNLGMTSVAVRINPGLIGESIAAKPTPEDWKRLVSLSIPTLIAMLGERIGVLSDSIVLTSVLGSAAAAKLFLTQRLANLGQMILNGISGAIWPSLAEMNARGERVGFNLRLVEITRLIAVLGVAGLAPVLAFNPHFLRMWVGSQNDGGRIVVLVASILAIVQGIVYTYTATLVSTGFVGRLARPAILSSLLNLVLSVALSYYCGLIGPILGTLLSTMAVQLWYVPMQLRLAFGTSLRKLFLAAAVPLCWGIPYALGLIALAEAHRPPGWFALLGELAISALVFLVFAFKVILGPHDRELWRARLIAPLLNRFTRKKPDPGQADIEA